MIQSELQQGIITNVSINNTINISKIFNNSLYTSLTESYEISVQELLRKHCDFYNDKIFMIANWIIITNGLILILYYFRNKISKKFAKLIENPRTLTAWIRFNLILGLMLWYWQFISK